MGRPWLALALAITLAAASASALSSSAFAQQAPITVEGRVTNGTSGGGDAGGLTVVLHEESGTSHQDQEAVTDSAGRFRFDGVEYDAALVYGLSVTYRGALYGVNVDLSAGSPPAVEIVVYEATSDDDALSAASASVLYAAADESTRLVAVLEIIQLVNGSDRTYVPGPEPMDLVRFGLPPGAARLRVDTRLPGADFVQVDRGFALIASIPPGEHEILYTYEFPYSGRAFEYGKSFNYGADRLRVLAPVDVLRISSGRLGGPKTTLIGQREYHLLEATGIERGASIDLLLEDLPQPGLADRVRQPLDRIRFELAAPVALGVLMAGVIAYALWRRARERDDAAEPSEAGD
ncbi:MAG: hypothetical protein IH862_02530 [Chloroflexi bacterium]|nr:hypothetical protein [Chloroflexota bacterium]